MAIDTQNLYAIAAAADSNICGLAILTPNFIPQPNWFIVNRLDGLVIRLDTINGNPPNQAAINAIMSVDLSQAAIDARETTTIKNLAMSTFLSDPSILARITRALALVVMDEINLIRAAQVIGTATAIWNAPSVANGAGTTSPNLTVTGAVIGDVVDVAPPVNPLGLLIYGYVSAANTVAVRLQNNTGAAINLASGTWGVAVRRPRNLTPRTVDDLQTAVTARIQMG